MNYKLQTSRSIWKSKAYKSYMWSSKMIVSFPKVSCFSVLNWMWIVRQENQSSPLFLSFFSIFNVFSLYQWSPLFFFPPPLFSLFFSFSPLLFSVFSLSVHLRSSVGERIGIVEIFMGFWAVRELKESLFFFYRYFFKILYYLFVLLFYFYYLKKTLTDEKKI